MVKEGNTGRYCLIKKDAGPVSICLCSDKDIITGSEFRLYDADRKTVLRTWKMSPENGAKEFKTLPLAPEHLHQATLVWQVLCCAIIPSVHKAALRITAHQDGRDCKLTVPAIYSLDNVPPCEVNTPERINGSMVIMGR